jgi:hypothetical protein
MKDYDLYINFDKIAFGSKIRHKIERVNKNLGGGDGQTL